MMDQPLPALYCCYVLMLPKTKYSALLPQNAIVVEANPSMWESGLLPAEEHYVRSAATKRRREFTAGRNCARQALQLLGLETFAPILPGTHREPIFPSIVAGTITHTVDYCAAAVIRKGQVLSIGIDAEPNEPLEASVVPLILLPEEQLAIRRMQLNRDCDPATLFFNIKEAFYKAYFQIYGSYLDFLEAKVKLKPENRSFTLQIYREPREPLHTTRFHGFYDVDEKHVYAAVTLSRPEYEPCAEPRIESAREATATAT